MTRVLGLLALLAAATLSIAQTIPNFTLASVPSVGDPLAINDLGHLLGKATIAGVTRGRFWSPETGLVDLPLLPGTVTMYAMGMNNHDQVVGFCLDPANVHIPFLWSPSTGIEVLETPTNSAGFSPFGIDDSGNIAGHLGHGPGAWVSQSSTWIPIPEMRYVTCMSPGGTVCGTSGVHIMTWKRGIVNHIYPIQGYYSNTPGSAANDCGQVAGYLSGSPLPDDYPAFFHDAIRGTLLLGFGYPQYKSPRLTSINTSGFAVGSESTSNGYYLRGFTVSTGFVALGPYLGVSSDVWYRVQVNGWSQIAFSMNTGLKIATPIPGPPPTIASISPVSVEAGGGDLMLRIDGSNYSAISSGRLDDANMLGTAVSTNLITMKIDGAELQHAGTHAITVQDGRQVSNVVQLTVLPLVRHPASFTLNHGTIVGGDLASLIGSDDQYLEGSYSWIGARGEPNFDVDVQMTAVPLQLQKIDVKTEVSSVMGSATVKFCGFDNSLGQWVLLGSTPVGGQDEVIAVSIDQNPSRFVDGAGQVSLRVSFYAGPDSGRTARARIDCVEATVFP